MSSALESSLSFTSTMLQQNKSASVTIRATPSFQDRRVFVRRVAAMSSSGRLGAGARGLPPHRAFPHYTKRVNWVGRRGSGARGP